MQNTQFLTNNLLNHFFYLQFQPNKAIYIFIQKIKKKSNLGNLWNIIEISNYN